MTDGSVITTEPYWSGGGEGAKLLPPVYTTGRWSRKSLQELLMTVARGIVTFTFSMKTGWGLLQVI